jgi:hypothetical protein
MHTFRPFSKHDGGAVTMVNQMLAYRTSHTQQPSQAAGKVLQTSSRMNHLDKSFLTNSVSHLQQPFL